MQSNKLLRTNVIVSVILIIGFALTAVLSYQANYKASVDNIEHVSMLTAEGIYYQLTTKFTKPVNVSLTMSHDSLLKEHLASERQRLDDEAYVAAIAGYLEAYRDKYQFDSVFLASTASGRYYNFNGVDRVLTEEEQEDQWFYDLLADDEDYSLNIDNDEVDGAENAITVFVNCKIKDADQRVLGIVGVGIRIEHLTELLASYEKQFNISAYLVDQDGTIEISTAHTGYENVDWFKWYHQEKVRADVLDWYEAGENLAFWTVSEADISDKSYVVTRYIPELSWHLIVVQDTSSLVAEMSRQLYRSCFLIAVVILLVLVIITTVIKKFNQQVTDLLNERQATFRKATEELYDNIYELNITRNSYAGERTAQYFESLGAQGLPYDQGLRVIAAKQIKEEFRQGYISTFGRDNVIREFENGNNHLQYDFMITQDGEHYHWMRIDAYIFYSQEDDSIHMFSYRKSIDEEKRREQKAETDEMTGCYTKKATERLIDRMLLEQPDRLCAFYIFDIDNFKEANDQQGHAFGDICIQTFTETIRQHFRADDVLGRLGGDEFAAFIPIPSRDWAIKKAEALSQALNTICVDAGRQWPLSASIGVAFTPADGADFATVYQKADQALYTAKASGKGRFAVYTQEMGDQDQSV